MSSAQREDLSETPDLHGAFPRLTDEQIDELRKLGGRFSQPPKKRDDTAAA